MQEQFRDLPNSSHTLVLKHTIQECIGGGTHACRLSPTKQYESRNFHSHSIKYFINYNHKLKIILFTVEGSLWENGSRHMLQPSSKASWIPSSWKAETDAMRFSAFLTFPIPGTYKQSTQKKKKIPIDRFIQASKLIRQRGKKLGEIRKTNIPSNPQPYIRDKV